MTKGIEEIRWALEREDQVIGGHQSEAARQATPSEFAALGLFLIVGALAFGIMSLLPARGSVALSSGVAPQSSGDVIYMTPGRPGFSVTPSLGAIQFAE